MEKKIRQIRVKRKIKHLQKKAIKGMETVKTKMTSVGTRKKIAAGLATTALLTTVIAARAKNKKK